jgi:uncharacterized protein YjeT (DUF2065 family)
VAEATYLLVAGNLRLRTFGVFLFVVGVVVRTVANIYAL